MIEFITKYWLEAIMTAACGLFGALYHRLTARVKREIKEQQLLKEGVLALLHDRLYQGCRDCIRQGHVDVEGLKNIEYMYRSYHDLGGNGTGTELYKRVTKLPIKEDAK